MTNHPYALLPPQMGHLDAPFVEQLFVGYDLCCEDGDVDLLRCAAVVRATQMLSSVGMLAVELLAVQHITSRQELIDAEYVHDCPSCRERRQQILGTWPDDTRAGGFLILMGGDDLAKYVQAAAVARADVKPVENVHPIGAYL